MQAQDLVKENNEKRDKLTKENLRDYEEMLIYIRLNNKSEQQTEEILMELLNHLLEAQSKGKTARDIFGEDLKAYSDELKTELPKETKKNRFLFIGYLGLNLFGWVGITIGIVGYVLDLFINQANGQLEFPIGTGLVAIIINLGLLALFVYFIERWINRSLFKKKTIKKWVEFIQIWAICTVFIGLTVLVVLFMPSFGTTVSISYLTVALAGLILYLASKVLNKKIRVTK